jgi:hypothetical protein
MNIRDTPDHPCQDLRPPRATGARERVVPPPAPLPTQGLAWPRHLTLRDGLSKLPLAHDQVLPYLLFLAGLRSAADQTARAYTPGDPGEGDGRLTRHAGLSLADAVEFSLQEQAQALAKSSSRIAGDTAFQCLFMGVAYAQSNHPPAVHSWLIHGSFEDNLTRLLDAMGVLAWTQPHARRLTARIMPRVDDLIRENFGPEVARLM